MEEHLIMCHLLNLVSTNILNVWWVCLICLTKFNLFHFTHGVEPFHIQYRTKISLLKP